MGVHANLYIFCLACIFPATHVLSVGILKVMGRWEDDKSATKCNIVQQRYSDILHFRKTNLYQLLPVFFSF